MPTKIQLTTDEMLIKISTQITELEDDVEAMKAIISEHFNCTGTEENPHNHDAEIAILRQEVKLCEETISKLNLLMHEINLTSKSLDQIDNELSLLLEELENAIEEAQYAKTSEMLMWEIEYYEAEAQEYMYSGNESIANQYKTSVIPNLKNQYIDALQREIDFDCQIIISNGGDYRKDSSIIDRTKTLIDFVNEENLNYPNCAEINKLNDLRIRYGNINKSINFADSSSGKDQYINIKQQMEKLGQAAIDKMFFVQELSEQLGADKTGIKIQKSIDTIAVEFASQEQLVTIITKKLEISDDLCYDEAVMGFLCESNLNFTYDYIDRNSKDGTLAHKALLHWINTVQSGEALSENPMPKWWIETIPQIPSDFVTEGNYSYSEIDDVLKSEYFNEYYIILHSLENLDNPNIVFSIAADTLDYEFDNNLRGHYYYVYDYDTYSVYDTLYNDWKTELFGHLDTSSNSIQRRKFLLKQIMLGEHSQQKYGLTVYPNITNAEFENAQQVYLDIYGYYDEYYNTIKLKNINGDKTITGWMNKSRINRINLTDEEQKFADDVIAGLYIITDRSVKVLASSQVWVFESEDGFLIDTVVGEDDTINHYDYNMSIRKYSPFNKKYLSAQEFHEAAGEYYQYKISNNLYTRQCTLAEYRDLQELALDKINSSPEIADKYNSLSEDEKAEADLYIMNYIASLEDKKEIVEFRLSRLSDRFYGDLQDLILVMGVTVGLSSMLALTASAKMAALITSVVLDSASSVISLANGDTVEGVISAICAAIGAGAAIKSIVKSGSTAFKAIASKYGDAVAEAISKYGDDFIEMSKYCDEGTVLQAKRFYADIDEAILTASGGVVQGSKTSYKEVLEGELDDIFKSGKVTKESISSNLSSFSGKSADEIADVLRNQGYDVTVRNSTKSSSGAQIIEIGNAGNGRNITQVQVSPGGGRHGASPYIKISTSDQGIFKIVDGDVRNYISNAVEKATIFFTGGK